MRALRIFSLLFIVGLLALTSCQKETIVDTQVETPTVEPTVKETNELFSRSRMSQDGMEFICFDVLYPFDLLLEDGTSATISSEDDLNTFMGIAVDFVYPVDIQFEDGTMQTIDSNEALGEVFVECFPDTGWDHDEFGDWFVPAWEINFDNSCLQLVYPITVLSVDSVATTVNNETELTDLLITDIFSFSFPLNLEDEDGNSVVAADADELFELLSACSGGDIHGGSGIGTFACYELEYPLDLLLADGSTVTVNDDNEFADYLLNGEAIGFAYPLNLIDEEGNVTTVNSDDELNDALIACNDIGTGGGDPGDPGQMGDFLCYDFGYPLSITDMITGEVITFADATEFENYVMINPAGAFNLAYPVTLINVEDGTVVTVEDEEEFILALEDCF